MAIYVTIDLPATPSQLVAFLSGADALGATLIDADGPLLVAHIGFPDDQDTNDLDTDDLDEDVDTEDLDTKIPAAARIVAHLATLPDHTWHGSTSELHRHLDLHCALSHTTKAIRTLTADGTITVEKAHPTRVTAIYLTATGHDVHQDPVVRPFDRDATRARAAAGI